MRWVIRGARPYPGTRKSEDPDEEKTDDKVLTTERSWSMGQLLCLQPKAWN